MRVLNGRRERPRPSPIEVGALLLILVAAALLRLVLLSDLPPGLCLYEVMNGGFARDILDGRHGIYFAEAYGHEALYHYLQAASVGLLGSNAWGIRLPSTLCGLTLVLLVWWLARRLYGPAAALVAAGGIATGWWGTFYSRAGIRAISCPLLLVAGLIGFWEGIRGNGRRRWLAFALGGMTLGLALYTYPAARAAIWLPLLLVLHMALFDRSTLRARWRGLALFTLAACLVVAPLLFYLAAHPEERVAQLAEPIAQLKAGDPGPALALTGRTLLMPLGMRGDLRWLYNLAGRTIWEAPWAILFVLGLGLALWRGREPTYAALPLWLLLGLLPGMLTPDAPNTIRTIAALPAAYLLAALPVQALFRWLERRSQPWARWIKGLAGLAVVVLIATHGLLTWRDLGRWAQDFEVQWRYQTPILIAARAIDEMGKPACVSTQGPGIFVMSWQAAMPPTTQWRWFVGGRALLAPAGGEPCAYVYTDAVSPDPALLPWLDQAGQQTSEQQTPDKRPFYRIYPSLTVDFREWEETWAASGRAYLGAPATLAPLPSSIGWADKVDLIGYQWQAKTRAPGSEIVLLTMWETHAPADPSLALFVHLLDAAGQFVCGEDRLDMPAHAWQKGDRFVQVQRLRLPADLPPGTYWPEIGFYRRTDNVRLPVLENGQPVADRILLEKVQIE